MINFANFKSNNQSNSNFIETVSLEEMKSACNGARIDVLANSQNSKGQRRKRINIEESALLDAATFDDALKPIVEVSRYTCGKLAIVNPEELNQQIHFFTTPGWRGSDEYVRNMQMIRNMVDLKGEIVIGSDWKLGCWYGRGSSKSQILQKKRKKEYPIKFGPPSGMTLFGERSLSLNVIGENTFYLLLSL